MGQTANVKWVCKYCGTGTTRTVTMGKPRPGNCSSRGKDKNGKTQPHMWVKG